jgi:hypothetical protein
MNNINIDSLFLWGLLIPLIFSTIYVESNRFLSKNKKIKDFFLKLIEIYNHVCEHYPLFIDYTASLGEDNINENIDSIEQQDSIKVLDTKYNNKYHEKYLQKFKNFPNEYPFNNEEKMEIEKLFIDSKNSLVNSYNEQLLKLETNNNLNNKIIENESEIVNSNSNINSNINSINNDKIIMFLSHMEENYDYEDLIDNYRAEPDSVNIEELWEDFLVNKKKIDKELEFLKKQTNTFNKSDEEIREDSYNTVVTKHLKKHFDNYLFEATPLGNVYMRLNISKNAFEYYSDCTIPYRYLEAVGRKYVTTFFCKPFFIDVDEEFKKGILAKEQKHNTNISAKNYSKETLDVMRTINSKNNSNVSLPNQIKANLPSVNDSDPNKHLLKERSNTYICEGKLHDSPILKKINKKNVDKRLNMTFSEFKKMQQENKK